MISGRQELGQPNLERGGIGMRGRVELGWSWLPPNMPDPSYEPHRPTDKARQVDVDNYFELIDVAKGDRVLDLGGNRGFFSRMALDRGAEVLAVEPEPVNISFFKARSPEAILLEGAVIGDDEPRDVRLYINSSDMDHSMVAAWVNDDRYITVHGFPFVNLCEGFRPTLIKCDIEGGEFLLPWDRLPDSTRTVVAELHVWKESGGGVALLRMLDALESLGFTCQNGPIPLDEDEWVRLVNDARLFAWTR